MSFGYVVQLLSDSFVVIFVCCCGTLGIFENVVRYGYVRLFDTYVPSETVRNVLVYDLFLFFFEGREGSPVVYRIFVLPNGRNKNAHRFNQKKQNRKDQPLRLNDTFRANNTVTI